MDLLNSLKPKAPAPKLQSASDGPLVWIDCEVYTPGLDMPLLTQH